MSQSKENSDEKLCERIVKVIDRKKVENLSKSRDEWNCERLKKQTVDEKDSELYFGIYFEERATAEKCGKLSQRDQVVIYVEKDVADNYTQGMNAQEWDVKDECGLGGGSNGANTFMVGRREDLINFWWNQNKESCVLLPDLVNFPNNSLIDPKSPYFT